MLSQLAAWFVIPIAEKKREREREIPKQTFTTQWNARRNSASIWLSIDGDFRFVLISLHRVSLPVRGVSYLSHRTCTATCLLSAETLLSWDLPEIEARSTTSQSKCLCQTSGCLCCVDLNLTAAIDIGGPVCINLRQKEQNVTLNLTYRDNPVHNATTRIGK